MLTSSGVGDVVFGPWRGRLSRVPTNILWDISGENQTENPDGDRWIGEDGQEREQSANHEAVGFQDITCAVGGSSSQMSGGRVGGFHHE